MSINSTLESSQNNNKKELHYIKISKQNSIQEKISLSYMKLYSYQISKHYQSTNILFKVLYDKLYRSNLYKIILNSEDLNKNISRNLIYLKEDLSEFRKINKILNQTQIDNEEYDAYDLQLENDHIFKSFSYFVKRNYCFYAYFFFLMGAVFMRIQSKSNFYKVFSFYSGIGVSFGYFIYMDSIDKKIRSLNKNYSYEILSDKYNKEIDIYKRYYYDEE